MLLNPVTLASLGIKQCRKGRTVYHLFCLRYGFLLILMLCSLLGAIKSNTPG